MSRGNTIAWHAWNVTGKPYYYDASSVTALCITTNNVKMEQTLNASYIDLLMCSS
jgi:hypothetical protein